MPDFPYSPRRTQAFAITPSNTVPVQGPNGSNGTPISHTNGIHAVSSGNVTATFEGDRANSTVTFPVIAGTYYPYALAYVYTSTTATIIGLL